MQAHVDVDDATMQYIYIINFLRAQCIAQSATGAERGAPSLFLWFLEHSLIIIITYYNMSNTFFCWNYTICSTVILEYT